MNEVVYHKKRPIIYAVIMTIGIALLYNIARNLSDNIFFTATFILYLVLLFELYATSYHGYSLIKQMQLLAQTRSIRDIQLVHHLFMPSLLYFSISGFIYFHQQPFAEIVVLIIGFVTFSLLFVNIRAFYQDKFKLLENTNNIYDFLGLIVAFLSSASIFSAIQFYNLPQFVAVFPLAIVFVIIAFLTMTRFHIEIREHRLVFLMGILLFLGATSLTLLLGQSLLITALLVTFYYYYYYIYLHHFSDGTANWKIVVEYITAFLLMLVLIFYGFN